MTDQNAVPVLRNVSISEVSQWIVLIVDDEPDNRTIAETVLTFSGAKVHTASQGAEGLAVLKDITASLVLLDLSMPVMDGWEMLTQIRANATTHNLPVIALTAHAMAGDRERVLEAGFDGYIAKPFRIGTFMADLIHCLEAAAAHTKILAAK